MATKRIETQLSIRAVDRYSSVVGKMGRVTGRFAEGVRTEMSRLQGQRVALRLIKDFEMLRARADRSGQALDGARATVRKLEQDMRAARRPTADMHQALAKARKEADRLSDSHNRNRAALNKARGSLKAAGVSTGDLASEQDRLATSVERGTSALGAQVEKMKRFETLQSRLAAERNRMERSLATGANLSFVGAASMQTGRRIVTGLSGPVREAMNFETAMADVRKVVDFEAPDGLKTMSDDILKLTTRIPMAATGIASIVAAGGQSGIQEGNLLAFAEMAAKVGVAFDISAEKSGDAMAKIKTGLKLSLDDTGKLFDAINHLSNKMASEAPTVLDFARRVGSDGLVKGFNPTETVAFGSAMIAAGAQSDVAATSFRNMGNALVRGAASTSKQRAAFRALGLDAVAVAKAMQKDAVGTTIDVMERINALPDHVRSATVSQLFGDEARALMPLITNLDLLRQSLGLVANEQDYVGSAEAEYAARAATTANNLQLLSNKWTRLSSKLGSVVLPHLNELMDLAGDIIDRIVIWTDAHPKLTKAIVMGGIAMGGMAVAAGAVATAAAGVIGMMAVTRFGLAGLGLRAAFAATDLLGVGAALGGLGRRKRLRLSRLVAPLRWTAALIPPLRWKALAGGLKWSRLIRPLIWAGRGALRFIPVIGWATLAGELAWHALIKPLGWDRYLPSIDWSRVWNSFSWEGWMPRLDWSAFISAITWPQWFSFEWRQFLPEWRWSDYIPKIDLTGCIKWPDWPGPKGAAAPVAVDEFSGLQMRAGGGAFGRKPLVVGEKGPELYFPNRSGFIATNRQLLQVAETARSIRQAGAAAVMTAASVATPAAAMGDVAVHIHGGITIAVDSGVTDPEGIAERAAELLGGRIQATLVAGFSD